MAESPAKEAHEKLVIPLEDNSQTWEAVKKPDVRVRSSSLVDQFHTVDPISDVTGNPAWLEPDVMALVETSQTADAP
jgi:hypothetical protein